MNRSLLAISILCSAHALGCSESDDKADASSDSGVGTATDSGGGGDSGGEPVIDPNGPKVSRTSTS